MSGRFHVRPGPHPGPGSRSLVRALAVALLCPVLAPASQEITDSGPLTAASLARPFVLPLRGGNPEIEYFALLARFDPVFLTQLGVHTFDGTFGEFGPGTLEEASRAWRRFEEALRFGPGGGHRFETALLIHDARRRRFEIDSLRVWSRDPGTALRMVASGLDPILKWSYAPREERMRSLLARVREIPAFLNAAAERIGDPPRLLTEQAITQAEALSGFLLHELQAEAMRLADRDLGVEITEAATAALEAVWTYRLDLVRSVLPRSVGGFALGEDRFLAYLRVEEGIDASLEDLRAEAEAELDRLGIAFRRAAAEVDANLPPRDVMLEVSRRDATSEDALNVMERALEEAHAFIVRDPAFPPVEPIPLLVRPTPRFSRWSNAGLSMPGPFETAPPPGFLFVTLPDPGSPLQDQEERSRFLNRGLIYNLAAHEGYPGHALHLALLRDLPSPVRRAVACRSFLEGWAHYAEMTAMARGMRAGDPTFRLATLQSALRRAGRFRAALGLHTEGWSLQRAAREFEDRCFLEPSVARREAERGVFDPLYCVYALGRLRLEALREELESLEGDDFDLGRFHRRLLDLGSPPISLAREAILGGSLGRGTFLDE